MRREIVMDLFDGTYELVQGISIHEVLFGRGLVLRSMRIQRLHIRVHSCSPSTLATVHQKLLVLLDRFIIHVRLVLQYELVCIRASWYDTSPNKGSSHSPREISLFGCCELRAWPAWRRFLRAAAGIHDGWPGWIANSELFSNYI